MDDVPQNRPQILTTIQSRKDIRKVGATILILS